MKTYYVEYENLTGEGKHDTIKAADFEAAEKEALEYAETWGWHVISIIPE